MKRYFKEIDGIITYKLASRIVIIKDGMQIFNPTEEMILEDGWTEYIIPTDEPTEEERLATAKQYKIEEINNYDCSSEVNECYISYMGQTLSYWANKTERNDLKDALKDCIAIGRNEYRLDLRDLNVSITVSCEQLLQMLSALEVYAIDCYNKTTDHIFNVNAFTTIEEIQNYNYREGYPEKLTIYL